jgi:DNA polymerase-3 subunit epsilon
MKYNLQRFVRELVANRSPYGYVVLDTETTDREGLMCQIAILGSNGEPVLSTLINPECPISPEAGAVHGITDDMVRDAPTLPAVYKAINRALFGLDVVVYNAGFDVAVLERHYRRYGLSEPVPMQYLCAMLAFAEHYGEWDGKRQSFRWHKLGVACEALGIEVKDAHDALADCRMTLALTEKLIAIYPHASLNPFSYPTGTEQESMTDNPERPASASVSNRRAQRHGGET